jgi:hypothetical protein
LTPKQGGILQQLSDRTNKTTNLENSGQEAGLRKEEEEDRQKTF